MPINISSAPSADQYSLSINRFDTIQQLADEIDIEDEVNIDSHALTPERLEFIQKLAEQFELEESEEDTDLVVNNTWKGLTNSENKDSDLSIADLKEKIEVLDKKNKEKALEIENDKKEHDKIMQISSNILIIAQKEIQKLNNISKEQDEDKQFIDNIKQQLIIIHQDLQEEEAKLSVLEDQQKDMNSDLGEIEESVNEVDSNLNFVSQDIQGVVSEISKIKQDHEKINGKFDEIHEKISDVQTDQEQLEIRINDLKEEKTPFNITEGLFQSFIDGNKAIQESLKKNWKNIKNYTHSLASYTWENLTKTGSKIYSAASDAFHFLSVSTCKLVLKTVCNFIWSVIKNRISTTTWIALGIFSTCFFALALRTYPLITIVVTGTTFLLVKNVVMPIYESFTAKPTNIT